MSEKKQRNDNLTDATDRDPVAWIDSLPTERQRTQGHAMLELFGDVTGAEAVMWGPSMVGYGGMHYTYDSGRQGNTFWPQGSAPRVRSTITRCEKPHAGGRGASLRSADQKLMKLPPMPCAASLMASDSVGCA